MFLQGWRGCRSMQVRHLPTVLWDAYVSQCNCSFHLSCLNSGCEAGCQHCPPPADHIRWHEECEMRSVCAYVLSWCGRFCMSGLCLCRFGAGINTSCCPTTRSGLTGSSVCWAGRWYQLGDTTGRLDLLDIPLALASISDRTKTGCGFEQVDVTGKTDWDLGVARKSVSRKGKITVTPGNGYWFLSLRDKWVNHLFPKLNVYNFLETATI